MLKSGNQPPSEHSDVYRQIRVAMTQKPTNPEPQTIDDPAAEAREAAELIAGALRGDAVDPKRLAGQSSSDAFLAAVADHGVAPLLHHVLKSGATLDKWPDQIREALEHAAREEAVREAIRVEETRRVLAALDAERVVPLVLKGTALAYSLYPRPHLRTREDTDLLVRQGAVAEVVRVLGELGYRRHDRLPGERVLRQDTYLRQDDSGFTHALDLHWAISNRPALAESLDYAELRERAVAIETLSPCALGLCREDALLHACLHRLAHADEENLIWLYDVHLLVESMTPMEFARFARAAMQKRLGTASRNAVVQAQAQFHTALPFATLEDHFPEAKLAEEVRFGRGISPGKHRFLNFIADLRGLGGMRETLGWMREHAFPPPEYMREHYGANSSTWLPALYIRRGLKGVAALLKRSH